MLAILFGNSISTNYEATDAHIHGVDHDLYWDANGNLSESVTDGSTRRLCWTEDNRLQAFMEQGEQGTMASKKEKIIIYNYGKRRQFIL